MLNIVSSVLGPNRQGALSYLNENYRRDWWWWELARVSYVGGQEYLQPRLLSVDFTFPVRTTSQGQVADDTVLGTQTFTVDRQQLRSLLHRHEREQLWEYENRRTRSVYINFYAPIINMLVDSVTRKPPTRTGDTMLEEFWEHPDQQRQERMNSVMAHGLKWAQVYRVYFAVIDQDPSGDGKPYMYWVSPLDVLDWECDEKGDYVWLKQFISSNVERPTWNTAYQKIHRYRIWARDKITTFETDEHGGGQKQVDERDNKLGVVPWVPVYANRNPDADHPDGVSQMADLPKIANAIYNFYSLAMDMGYKEVFSLLTFPDKRIDTIQVGTSTVVGYDPGATGGKGPEYISPDPDQLRVLLEMIGGLIEQARQAVGVGRGRSESSKQIMSADAMELESKATESIMVDIAGAAEDGERRIAAMVQRYKTEAAQTGADTSIDYPREFDVRSLQADVMEATSMRALGLSPEVMLRMRQDIVRRKYANLPADQLALLVDSIQLVDEPMGLLPGNDGSPPPDKRPGSPGASTGANPKLTALAREFLGKRNAA